MGGIFQKPKKNSTAFYVKLNVYNLSMFYLEKCRI